ncbi:alkanesulfonate transporter substrate-binding subunit [Pigmentiphaga humi]|uniref:Alkanesulfonate transporter substrate-binding subunit n=1 Tax=Pigmentiphaga humi TaxID=2478468 RepID=A0A3P4AWS1_9BURK|nr:ABC transporter substrate-binding protein [Pigmentiphaga humi]VCU68483.1 alkanesulfonate transporter substrate-binding subunit [Pigmentiphaga humi]
MNISRIVSACAAACILCVATLAPGMNRTALAADGQPAKVSMAILYLTADTGVFLAIERGYFAQQGVDVELSRITSSADAISLLATNRLDVGSGSATPGLFNAFRRGVPVQIVSDKSSQLPPGTDTGGLLVRKDLMDSGAVKSVGGLKGKRIAVNNIQSMSLNHLARALALEGLTKDDVTLVELPFNQFIPAMQKKAIDGVLAFAPLYAAMIKMQVASPLPEASLARIAAGDNFNIMLFSQGFAKTDAAKRFMVAYLQGQRDLQRAIDGKADIRDVCKVINKYIPAMAADCAGMSFTGIDPNGGVNLASLERFQKEWLQWGIMTDAADIAGHVNLEFSRHALAVLGPYR